MRRISIALFGLTTLTSLASLACQSPKPPPPGKATSSESDAPTKLEQTEPTLATEPVPVPAPVTAVVRKELLAEDLPTPPTLEPVTAAVVTSGEFGFSPGTDELVPRVALALPGGLLLAGQAYHDRRPGQPPQTWRWTGFIPNNLPNNLPNKSEATATLHEPGAIRAGIVSDGRGLLTGSSGTGFDARGWFATVDADGTLAQESALDSPNTTEMFDLVPGLAAGELAVVAGYVDAQAWLVSLDAKAQRRWEKYIGSYGYTQARGLARLDSGDLLAIGSRAQDFGELWSAVAPGDGGESAAGDDVAQTKIEIEGADPNQILRAIVDLGDAGYLALGTAKRNHLQAHDQLVAVGFDRAGALTWSRVIEGIRVVDVLGASPSPTSAAFVVSVPLGATPELGVGLALITLEPGATGPVIARQLADSEHWTSAGFIAGSTKLELISFAPTATGMAWRRVAAPN